MKVLCICAGGNTRSVACATALKRRGHNAVATGWHDNAPDPIDRLSEWADRIVIMYQWDPTFVPADQLFKIRYLDVGHDIWHDPTNPQLVAMVNSALDEWESRGFD